MDSLTRASSLHASRREGGRETADEGEKEVEQKQDTAPVSANTLRSVYQFRGEKPYRLKIA